MYKILSNKYTFVPIRLVETDPNKTKKKSIVASLIDLMKSNSHIKKFPFKELRKCAKNEVWEKMDQNWSLGPATTSSIQKPEQPTN